MCTALFIRLALGTGERITFRRHDNRCGGIPQIRTSSTRTGTSNEEEANHNKKHPIGGARSDRVGGLLGLRIVGFHNRAIAGFFFLLRHGFFEGVTNGRHAVMLSEVVGSFFFLCGRVLLLCTLQWIVIIRISKLHQHATSINQKNRNRDHYFRHLVQSSTSMADECPSATLYYSTAIDNTIGSPHIVLRFPGATPLGDGQERLCDPAGINCIGDTHTNFVTLYSDRGLTNQVATIASTAKVVNIKEDGERIYVVTASILYDDTNNELNYGGYFIEEEFNLSEEPHDMPVSGGTLDCAMNFGTIDFSHEPDATYGSVEFHIVDMNN